MATSKSVMDYLIDQSRGAGHVRARAMFGEYALYCDEKPVAVVCNDQLYLKPTKAGAALAGDVEMGVPYPGAKPRLLIPEEQWDDAEHLAALIGATAAELPLPKPKPKRKKKSPS
jgi:TfoX/Sxy family transcriptional regulator of competence genes